MRIGVNRRNNQFGRAMQTVVDFWEKHGNSCCPVERKPPWQNSMDRLFIWNGEKPSMQGVVNHVKKRNGVVIYAEYGYFRRSGSWQLDIWGINANSTNRLWIGFPEPNAEEKIKIAKWRFAFSSEKKVAWDEPGDYVLLALQTPTDVNITRHAPCYERQGRLICDVQAAMKVACPNLRLVIRQHPKLANGKNPPLGEQLNRCRFLVTINSNTVHEAMVAQKDCVCLGPHVYTGMTDKVPGQGGVVFSCNLSVKKLAKYLRMADDRVESGAARDDSNRDMYMLYALDREWNIKEIEDGAGLLDLLRGRPKALGARAEMHPEWHELRDRRVRSPSR